MWDIYERSATQIEGLSPEEYIEQSIRYPNEYIVEDYPEGVMPLIFENLSTTSPSTDFFFEIFFQVSR